MGERLSSSQRRRRHFSPIRERLPLVKHGLER